MLSISFEHQCHPFMKTIHEDDSCDKRCGMGAGERGIGWGWGDVSAFWFKVNFVITALKVTMALALDFRVFGAHVMSCTTLNPQVDPIAVREFQDTVSNVAAAVSWFASKPLVGVNSIITPNVRADIHTKATDILNALTMPEYRVDTSEMLMLTDRTTARVHFFGKPYLLEVSKADTQLLALIKCLYDAKCILTQYKDTIHNSMAYAIFFGVTDSETASAMKEVMNALDAPPHLRKRGAASGGKSLHVKKRRVAT